MKYSFSNIMSRRVSFSNIMSRRVSFGKEKYNTLLLKLVLRCLHNKVMGVEF